ncbi:MAG: 2-dehydropantoate 2-reductase N-terminal domain-containing protein, partial [Candidatus Kapaibacterium sp.]
MINQNNRKHIAIIGAGGWGTALAMVLSSNFESVVLWTRNKDQASEINSKRTNSKYLSINEIPQNIIATTKPDDIKDIDVIVNAVPTQYIRNYYKNYNLVINNKYII